MTQRSENIWSQCVHLNGIIGMGCLFSVTLSTSTFDDKHKSDLVKTKSDKLTPQEYNILIKACVSSFSSDSSVCEMTF